MLRSCVSLILLSCMFIVTYAENSSEFTSPVLHRTKTNYLNFAGKTYYFGTVFKANFYRAMQFCRQQNMQLASIDSQAVNDRIGKFVEEIGTPYGHFWTSGTNLADEYQWIWLSTGNNIIYANWHPGEPTLNSSENVTESCIEARHFGKGFTWNDLNCYAEAYFICELVENCQK